MNLTDNDIILLKELSYIAWKVRENAFLIGKTKVGAALLGEDKIIYSGCNVEHKFRCHDIHAEVNAISNMVSAGVFSFSHIVIVAEREKFTPCGSCMDWIFQHGGSTAIVAFQPNIDSEFEVYTASSLMPHYPK